MTERLRRLHTIHPMLQNQHWEARANAPLEISSDTFIGVRQELAAGDLVIVVGFDNTNRVVEEEEWRILQVTSTTVAAARRSRFEYDTQVKTDPCAKARAARTAKREGAPADGLAV